MLFLQTNCLFLLLRNQNCGRHNVLDKVCNTVFTLVCRNFLGLWLHFNTSLTAICANKH